MIVCDRSTRNHYRKQLNTYVTQANRARVVPNMHIAFSSLLSYLAEHIYMRVPLRVYDEYAPDRVYTTSGTITYFIVLYWFTFFLQPQGIKQLILLWNSSIALQFAGIIGCMMTGWPAPALACRGYIILYSIAPRLNCHVLYIFVLPTGVVNTQLQHGKKSSCQPTGIHQSITRLPCDWCKQEKKHTRGSHCNLMPL